MTRRRYIQDRTTGELIEVTADHREPMRNDAGALWGDRHYDGLQATDGSDISTRSKHRDSRHSVSASTPRAARSLDAT